MSALVKSLFPLFVSLEGRVCLVVGGGPVAERKVRVLLPHGPTIRLIAERRTDWLDEACRHGTVEYLGHSFREDFLDNVDLVFAATSDSSLNRKIAAHASERRLWCNMASEPEKGSFFLPAVLQRGPLTIAVSTGGKSPSFAARICRELSYQFGEEWSDLLNLMALLRTAIQSKGLGTTQNQALFRSLADLPLLEWIRNRKDDQLAGALQELCGPWLSTEEVLGILDRVWKQSS